MRTLSDSSFFRVFDLLVGTSNPGQKSQNWTIDGVQFECERHTFGGRTHSYAIDVFAISHTGRRRWSLTVVKETWWDGSRTRTIKTQSWSKLIEGSRGDIINWLRAQEHAMERHA